MSFSNDPHRDGVLLNGGAPLAEATGAIVLLHGRGADAEDILSLGEAFDLPGVAYLAPEAYGHTWYPESFLAPIEENEPWLSSAIARIKAVVEIAQAAGVPANRIVICGFSQGACLSSEFVARFPQRYGGVVAFTGGLIGPPGMELGHPGDLAGTPVFFGSGDPDPHVPWARVEESAEVLRGMGASVETRRYPGRPHTVSREEFAEARLLVKQALESAG